MPLAFSIFSSRSRVSSRGMTVLVEAKTAVTRRPELVLPFEVHEGTQVLDVGLQIVRKEQIVAKENREVAGVLEETAVA